MPLDILHIIFLSLAILLLVIVFILLKRMKSKSKILERRVNSIVRKYENDKTYLEKEIKRQEYIIENYKQKNGSKINNVEFPVTENALSTESVIFRNEAGQSSLISKTNVLDDEEFRDKNKKLWELSIAVHKEKERIDKLRVEILRRHEEVTKSINYAQRIQKALLPDSNMLDSNFSDYFIFWKPKDIVSGDFYWFNRFGDKIVIVVADCTGHGVPGAFMSVLGISFLNDIFSKENNLKSFQILEKLRVMIKHALHQELRDRTKATDGIDLALCIINEKTLELDYAGANNPLYLVRNNQIQIFAANRNPIGIHPSEMAFANQTCQLMKNDKLYMFSDGYFDQFGGDAGRKFLKKNFQRLLIYMSEQNISMNEEKEVLNEAFHHWKGKIHPQIDDILVLGLKI